MAYTTKTFEEIMSEIKINLVNNVDEINDLNVGSVIETLISTISNTISEQYEDLDEIYNSSRISTATEDDLEQIGAIVGITRDEGSNGSGYVSFITTSPLSSDITLTQGSQVSTQPNTENEQLIYDISTTTTFSKTISEEEHTYHDGIYDYKLDQRLLDSISELKGLVSTVAHTFIENTDYEIINNFSGVIIDEDDYNMFVDCDSATGWSISGGAVTPTVNTTTKHQGTGALNQIKTGTTYDYLTYTYDIGSGNEKDLNGKQLMMNQYILDSTVLSKIEKITLSMSSDILFNNSKTLEFDASDLSTGWNLLILDQEDPLTTSTGNIDIESVRYIKIKIDLNNTTDTIASGDLIMDNYIYSTYIDYEGDIVRWIYTTGTMPDDASITKTSYVPLSWEVPIESVGVGTKYNVTKDKIVYKVSTFSSISQVNNYNPITGGINIETDEELRTRIQSASDINNVATVSAIEANVLNFSYINTCNVIDMPLLEIDTESHVYSASVGKFELDQKVARNDSNLRVYDEFNNINATINNSVTTIPFNNCSNLASKGVILIESEEISFTGNTGTSLTGCTRGYNGTTPVTHSSGTKVIELSFYDSLNGGIDASQITITLNSTSDFNTGGGVVLIDSEYIKYTGISSNDLTGCTRGWEGSAATTHTTSTTVTRSTYERNTDFILTNDLTINFYDTKNEPINGDTIYVDYDTDRLGYFKIYVTGVNGEVNTSQITEITDFVADEVKSAGIMFTVEQPTYIDVAVSAAITYDSGYSYGNIGDDIEAAITDYINSLNIGDDVLYSKLIQVIMNVTGVADVNITVPSGDYTIDSDEKAQMGTITLT